MPIVGLGIAAVKTAADFQAGMSKVQSISGASADEMDKLTQKAKEMGAKTKFSATESADAFSYMAMAGWKTQDMLDGIEGVMYLAGATGEDLASTSDIVTDALTAFGMTAADTNRFVDVLAKTANSSNTSVSMMGETFKYLAPAAGALGYSVEDTSVAIGLMANSGIKASQSGTSLKNLLVNLAKPTDAMEASMKKLGISLTDSNGEMKPFNQLMGDMRSSFDKLTPAQKASEAATLAGKEGMAGLLAIVNSSQSDFDNLTESINNSNGAAKEMYDVANDNLTGRLTILSSTIESIAITFGERLMPYVENGAEKIQLLADKFSQLSDEQVDSIIKWAVIIASVGPALMIFGKTVSTVGKVVSIMGKLGGALKAAGGVMGLLTSPALIVVAVLAAIVVAGILVYKNWDKIKQMAIKFGENIKSVFNSSGTKVSEFKDKFASIGEKFGEIRDKAAELYTVMAPHLQKIGDVVKLVFQIHLGAFIGGAVGLFNSLLNTGTNIVSGLMTAFGGLLDFFTGVFTGDWGKALQGIQDIFGGGFSALVELAKAPINGVIGIINGMVSQINGMGITIPDWVPALGGKSFSVSLPTLSYLYKGTNNWGGGPAMIHDRGAEIVDLPSGTRVYPHDKSLKMARAEGSKSISINIPKIAETIIIREESDIDAIIDKLVNGLEKTAENMGG